MPATMLSWYDEFTVSARAQDAILVTETVAVSVKTLPNRRRKAVELDINSLDMLPSKVETALYPCKITCVTFVSLVTITLD
ncbi:hypothetical protein ACIBF6_36960 [Streptosporangium amethystogenes]|uniref:hypothetical protein n=1 Tax=Streptosporangium amethystogenes TaxID=2002 RepID=UPI003794F60D